MKNLIFPVCILSVAALCTSAKAQTYAVDSTDAILSLTQSGSGTANVYYDPNYFGADTAPIEATNYAHKGTGSASVQATVSWTFVVTVTDANPNGPTAAGTAQVNFYYEAQCGSNCDPVETATASADSNGYLASCSGYEGYDDDDYENYVNVSGGSLSWKRETGTNIWYGTYVIETDILSGSANVTTTIPNVGMFAQSYAYDDCYGIDSNSLMITL